MVRNKQLLQWRNKFLLLEEKFGNCPERPTIDVVEALLITVCLRANAPELVKASKRAPLYWRRVFSTMVS